MLLRREKLIMAQKWNYHSSTSNSDGRFGQNGIWMSWQNAAIGTYRVACRLAAVNHGYTCQNLRAQLQEFPA